MSLIRYPAAVILWALAAQVRAQQPVLGFVGTWVINKAESHIDSTIAWPLDTIKIARMGPSTYEVNAFFAIPIRVLKDTVEVESTPELVKGLPAGELARVGAALWDLPSPISRGPRKDSVLRSVHGRFRARGDTLIGQQRPGGVGKSAFLELTLAKYLSADRMRLIFVTDYVIEGRMPSCPYSDTVESCAFVNADVKAAGLLGRLRVHDVLVWDRAE